MNAKEALQMIWPLRLDQLTIDELAEINDAGIRALRLLAAAEANDGNCPETEAAMCRYTGGEPVTFPKGLSAVVPYSFAANLERERNGLAARVRELEGVLSVTPRIGLNDDGTLDEVVGYTGHLEQLDTGHWFVTIGDYAIWLHSKSKITATYEDRAATDSARKP